MNILIVQGDWNAKVGSNSYQTWNGTFVEETVNFNKRGLQLLEFEKYNIVLLANTLGCHKNS